jgi:hypothetical protein
MRHSSSDSDCRPSHLRSRYVLWYSTPENPSYPLPVPGPYLYRCRCKRIRLIKRGLCSTTDVHILHSRHFFIILISSTPAVAVCTLPGPEYQTSTHHKFSAMLAISHLLAYDCPFRPALARPFSITDPILSEPPSYRLTCLSKPVAIIMDHNIVDATLPPTFNGRLI